MSAAPLDKARRSLEAARHLLDGGFYGESVGRSYYAAFYAARAALEQYGDTPRTHSGVRTAFSRRFVLTGQVAFDIGRSLRNLQDERQIADYDDGANVTDSAARAAIEKASRFVEVVSALVDLPPDL